MHRGNIDKVTAKAQKEAELKERRQRRLERAAQVDAEHQEMAEQQMLEIYGPQICVWECINCSAEYEQKIKPERCVKCGRFSFEKNFYRRKTGS